MTLRGKLGLWFVVLVLIAVIAMAMPATMKSSIMDTVGTWTENYSDAVDEASGSDEDEKDEFVSEALTVRIDDEISDYAGVAILSLTATRFSPESKVVANVVNIQPMLAIKARLNRAMATLNVAQVAERSALQELSRLNALAKGAGSVATKKVNYARAAWNGKKAEKQGVQFEVQAVKDETVQIWGEKIAGWVLAKDSQQWQRLLSRQDSLLLVTLPVDLSLTENVTVIRIAQGDNREQARKAYLVSSALRTDGANQGETYYFKTTTARLRSGMRLDAWIPTGSEPLSGVFIPEQAMVWYGGQQWVYVEKDEGLYQRRPVSQGLATAGGVFVEHDIEVGEQLVIQGAQMLLSEEFRWQILDEDDDD